MAECSVFESCPKDEPRPHPDDDRSKKKVKIRGDEGTDIDDMDADFDADSSNDDSHISATISPGMVPKTQAATTVLLTSDEHASPEMAMETSQGERMPAAIPVPSFKDKLLNKANDVPEEDDDIKLDKDDVVIDVRDRVPSISFSSQVLGVLNKKMGFAVIIKLLGRSITYRQLRMQL